MGMTKAFMGVVSCVSTFWRQFCIEKSCWEFEFCPLSGIKKRPLLRDCFSITTMLISICNTELVHCREVVRVLVVGGSTVVTCPYLWCMRCMVKCTPSKGM